MGSPAALAEVENILRRSMGVVRVVVGVATMGGATMMTVGSLVRQSVTRELPEKHVEGEELASLQQEGWCLMKEALPASQLAESLASFRKGAEAGTSIQLLKKAGFWQSSLGRFHLQTFSEEDKGLLAEVEQAWLPFVESHLPGIQRSDLQLLFSMPNSGDQIFHQDNSAPGLTVLVPLVDMNLDNGPTQLLPRSHLIDVSLADRLKDSSAALPACVPAGTALIYDRRTIHRGLVNPSKASRPVLVFRYDHPTTPPPGHTPLSTILYSCLGAVLCAIGEAKLLLE